SRTVNVGTSNVSATWIDWADWEAPPANATTLASGTQWSDYGPAAQGGITVNSKTCPWTTSRNGYACQQSGTNGSSSANNIPTSTTVNGQVVLGPICPTVDDGSRNSGRSTRYYNGCYDSIPTTTTSTSTNTTNSSGTDTICSNSSNCTV